MSEDPTGERDADPDPGPLSTGLAGLDEWLGGGLPTGSLVALVADPDSPSEELLYPPASANPARYLSTLRPAPEVTDHAAAAGEEGFDVEETDAQRLLDDPAGHISGLDPESVVVVDPATELEREGRERYRSFLETLKQAARTTDGVAVLHCPRMDPRALQRDLTLARADTVLELDSYVEVEGENPGRSWPTLTCRKSRFGPLPVDPLTLSFAGGVSVAGEDDGR